MTQDKSFHISESLYNKIVSVAYGDGSLRDKLKIFYLVATNRIVKATFFEFRKTAAAVHNMEEDILPAEILKKVEQKTTGLKNLENSFFADLLWVLTARPIISTVTAAIIVITITVTMFVGQENKVTYSVDEVRKADKDARYALAIVNEIFAQSSSTIKEDVLKNQVSQPINNGINFLNNLLKGEKNEIN